MLSSLCIYQLSDLEIEILILLSILECFINFISI